MRVKGNIKPDVLSIEEYAPIEGKVELRVRENISEFTETDSRTEEAITGYQYDEYAFIIDNEKGLEKKVKADLDNWIATGRALEVSPMASLYVTAKSDAVDAYTQELIEEGLL